MFSTFSLMGLKNVVSFRKQKNMPFVFPDILPNYFMYKNVIIKTTKKTLSLQKIEPLVVLESRVASPIAANGGSGDELKKKLIFFCEAGSIT